MAATTDRSDAMEKAARLVQRGELERAVKAYVRLFEQDRRDWSVGNTLGDLYVRVGQSKEAIAHFASLAEQLANDGFAAKARALYRKILRIQPDNAMARQRVDELDRQQGGSVSPFLKRVLETARASRETAETDEAHQAGEPLLQVAAPEPTPVALPTAAVPVPPVSPAPEPEPRWPEPQLVAPPTAAPTVPEPTPASPEPQIEAAQPVVGLPTTSAEWADEWAAVVPSAQIEHEHEISFTETALDIAADSEVEAFRRMETAADTAAARREYKSAFDIVEHFVTERPNHILALEKLVEIGVDAGLDVELQSAQLRLVKACVEAERYRQAWDAAADLVIRHPGDLRYGELLDRVGTVAKAHGLTFPAVPEFDDAVSELPVAPAAATHDVLPTAPAPTPTLHLVPPPQPQEPERAPQVIVVAPAPIAATPSEPAARISDPARTDAALSDELLREWSDGELAFDTIRNALLDEAAAGAEERLAEAGRFIQARRIEDAIRALEEAMCAPHLRATAGARLAQIYRNSDAPLDALACLEWVAEMPPATEESGHELAYELAVTLEALGQEAQALGVYRELLAEVGPGYRDIASRVEKLAAA